MLTNTLRFPAYPRPASTEESIFSTSSDRVKWTWQRSRLAAADQNDEDQSVAMVQSAARKENVLLEIGAAMLALNPARTSESSSYTYALGPKLNSSGEQIFSALPQQRTSRPRLCQPCAHRSPCSLRPQKWVFCFKKTEHFAYEGGPPVRGPNCPEI